MKSVDKAIDERVSRFALNYSNRQIALRRVKIVAVSPLRLVVRFYLNTYSVRSARNQLALSLGCESDLIAKIDRQRDRKIGEKGKWSDPIVRTE